MEESELNKEFKKNHLKLPEGYFESFDAKVIARLSSRNKRLMVWHNVRRWSIAAVIFMASGLGVFLYNQRTPEVVDIANVSVSETELESFQNENEVSDDEFVDLLSDNSVDSIYHLEVLSVSNRSENASTIENIEEEYSPLDDEIEI